MYIEKKEEADTSLQDRILHLSAELRETSRMWLRASKENEWRSELEILYYSIWHGLNLAADDLENIVGQHKSEDIARQSLHELYDTYMHFAMTREPSPPLNIIRGSFADEVTQIAKLIRDPAERGYYKAETWFLIKLKELLSG